MKPIQFLGHPLHPVLVHLPMGVLPLVAVVDCVAVATSEATWWAIGYWAAIAGLGGGVFAAASGFLDYLAIGDHAPALRRANRHLVLMAGSLSLFLGRLLAQRQAAVPLGSIQYLVVFCSCAGAIALLAGGWFGGDLVYGQAATENCDAAAGGTVTDAHRADTTVV